jgi:glycine cleavage system H protein
VPSPELPGDRRYAPGDLWVRPAEDAPGELVVGMTKEPLAWLGDAVYAELPAAGTELLAGEPAGLLESTSAVFEIVSPVAGTVTAVNPRAEDFPESLTEDPFGGGWFFRIAPSGADPLAALATAEEEAEASGGEE